MRQLASFDEVWTRISHALSLPKQIRNWTVNRDYLGRGDFVARWDDDQVVCELQSGSVIHVSRDDFEVVWQVWHDYVGRKLQRQAVREMTRRSKYIISILHQFLGEG